jgi:raffinose/stachyose/melibiose transport system permease protein
MTSTITAGPAVSAGPAPLASHPVRRRRSSAVRKRIEIALFAGPALLVYVCFVLLPVVLAAVYSFFKWNGYGPLQSFIGLENYRRALADPVFIGAIGHNLFVVILSLIVQGPIAIGVALLLNRKLRGRTFFRVIIFIPYVLSEVIAGLSWKLLLQPDGPFDSFLKSVGLGSLKQLWLADSDIVLWTVFLILTWKYVGFAIILFLAGLQSVPAELEEAGRIDGASWWQIQRHITLPLLGPTIRIWAFLSIIGSLQLFDMVWVVTGGGPAGATTTMATYMVQYGFQRNQLGFGSAVAVILFIISLVFALLYQRFVLRRDLQGSLTRGVG